MKREILGMSPLQLAVYRVLGLLVIIGVISIVVVTLIAFISGKAAFPTPQTSSPTTSPTSVDQLPIISEAVTGTDNLTTDRIAQSSRTAVFTRIGRLRIASASSPPAVIIVSIVFPYQFDDKPFYEELVAKTEDFRAMTKTLFAAFTTEALVLSDVEELKQSLLINYNAKLTLGQIDILYFDEYLIIE